MIRNELNLEKIPSSASVLTKLPEQADETHVVYTKIQKMARLRNMPYGFFNMTIWKPQSEPQIPLSALPREKWDSNQFSITTGPGPTWVDLVVNNLDEGPHPFHMVSSPTFLSFLPAHLQYYISIVFHLDYPLHPRSYHIPARPPLLRPSNA